VLKLIAATLLADGTHRITNVPDIVDVGIMTDLLAALGVTVESSHDGVLTMHNPGAITPVAPYELVEQIRASIVVLGPLLARCGYAKVSLPGGDDFGSRPIDMHLKGLEALGVTFTFSHGYVEGRVDVLRGAHHTLPYPSVGATENIVMAAVLAKGTSVIDNVAREPEIADLCHALVGMGAQIEGIGSSTLTIHGVPVEDLRPMDHPVVTDRLQVATYIAAVGVCGGEVRIDGARPEHMETLIDRFGEMGMSIVSQDGGILVHAQRRLTSVDVATLPYPGIATDYKPLVVAMLCLADGVGIVTENLYPGRFRYIEELQRLGADIRTDGHHAVVRGKPTLQGAPVRAVDIRAGATLIIAGLAADGATTICDTHHIQRGYDDLTGRLRSIGADIS
jgi:UDP-N-acetylglucosamine 1-carboxyvinyltransferase